MKKRFAVIGAGISGLCAAYWLKQKGLDVQVYEQSGQVGGVIISEKSSGFLVDLGPNSALETSEILRELITELGLEDKKIYGNETSQKRYVVKNGKLCPVPTSLFSFLTTSLFSWKAKLRLLKEPFLRPTSRDDISLADFVRYRLGREFLDYAINPFVAGVYAGDPENLSTAAGFPKLFALEQKYGSLIKGAILGARDRKKRKEVAKNKAKMFSFTEGMQAFPNALAEKLKEEIHLHTTVTQLIRRTKEFEIEIEQDGKKQRHSFDSVIICIPAYAIAKLISPLVPESIAQLSEIYYPPVSVVFMGFKKEAVPRELDGFGFLVPELEKRAILGSLWSSAIFPDRAPEDHVAFTTFVGGTRQPKTALLPDVQLIKLVQEELNALIGLTGDPVFIRIKKWEKAIPQYRLGYKNIQALLDDLELHIDGLYFAGNYRRGISVGDSVLSAHEIVAKITDK